MRSFADFGDKYGSSASRMSKSAWMRGDALYVDGLPRAAVVSAAAVWKRIWFFACSYRIAASTWLSQSGGLRISRGLDPSAGPTMPSRSIMSIRWAARP